ncbi:MAG: A24 family peptidase [Desulfosporosinus sp.]|nr:A24 family peptidase [Desulfosporosinus sp.]
MVVLILNFVFVLLTLLLAVIDFFTMRLPDKLTIPLAGVGLLHSSLMGSHILIQNGLAALVLGGLFLLTALIYPKGMGMGDAKYVTALTLFLGFPAIMITLVIATVIALLIGGIFLATKKKTVKDQIPFGPFLTIGAWLTMLIF